MLPDSCVNSIIRHFPTVFLFMSYMEKNYMEIGNKVTSKATFCNIYSMMYASATFNHLAFSPNIVINLINNQHIM